MSKKSRPRRYALGVLLLCGLLALNLTPRTSASSGTGIDATPDRPLCVAGHQGVERLRDRRGSLWLSAHAAPPQPQGDQTVEQTRKNIRVLKGLPEAQLFPLMNFVAASLGVRCGYCHVVQGKDAEGRNNWVWESDDKREKQTARRMMQMVLSVNNTNRADFRDNQVTCYTCHRGTTRPAAFPALPLAVSGHEDGHPAAPGAPAAGERRVPPTVEQIFARYREAVGAQAANVKTLVMKGTREASQGRRGDLEITYRPPDKVLIAFTPVAPQAQPTVYQAANGSTGWLKGGAGQRAMTAEEAEQIKRTARIYQPLKVAGPDASMKFAGLEKVGDRDAFVVESTHANGSVEKLFFDTQTGLLLRVYTLTKTVLTPVPEQIDYEDYRDVGGVKLPHTIRISEIDTFFSSTRKLAEIKLNEPVDDAKFNPPAPPPQK